MPDRGREETLPRQPSRVIHGFRLAADDPGENRAATVLAPGCGGQIGVFGGRRRRELAAEQADVLPKCQPPPFALFGEQEVHRRACRCRQCGRWGGRINERARPVNQQIHEASPPALGTPPLTPSALLIVPMWMSIPPDTPQLGGQSPAVFADDAD